MLKSVSLPSVKTGYKKFLTDKNGTKLYNRFKEILYTNDDSLIKYFNNHFLTEVLVPQKKRLSVCDIGGGDGKRIIQILKHLNSRYNKTFRLDFIEQSKVFCDDFKASLPSITPYSTVSIQNSTFEESELNGPYDFIFLIHSIFTFQNPETINWLLSLLSSDGKIVIFSNANDSFLGKLKDVLDREYDDKRLEIDDIKKNLTEKKIYFQSFQFNTNWTLKKDEFYSKMNIILNWLSLGRYGFFSEIHKKEIFNTIYSLIEMQEDIYYFSEKEEIIIIPSSYKSIRESQEEIRNGFFFVLNTFELI